MDRTGTLQQILKRKGPKGLEEKGGKQVRMRYVQEWSENMYKKAEPEIRPAKEDEDYGPILKSLRCSDLTKIRWSCLGRG
jgi:hypothetical protein